MPLKKRPDDLMLGFYLDAFLPMKYSKAATTVTCIKFKATAYPTVTPGMPIKGFKNDKTINMMDRILKILNPFCVNFSKRKKTILAISAGMMLAITIGKTVKDCSDLIKIVSTIIPA